MTQDDLPQTNLPTEHRWTLWTKHGGHWDFAGYGLKSELLSYHTDEESLVLPPGESPLMPGKQCHK